MPGRSKSGGGAVRVVTPMIPLAIALLHSAVLSSTSEANPNLSAVVPAVCEDGVEDYLSCHTEYPTGCNSNGKYDAYLNEFKNQVEWKDTEVKGAFTTRDQVIQLENKLPSGLGKANHANYLSQLSTLGEGKIYTVVGYLNSVKPEGKESSNCQLEAGEDDENVDFHIYIGFDAGLAERLRNKTTTVADKKSMNGNSMIVEMTPHYRGRFQPDWKLNSIQEQIGKRVRVTGQLMVDNEHYQASQDCGLSNHTSTCWRMTVWELHPVTAFEICESGTCDENSTGWSPLASSVYPANGDTPMTAAATPKAGRKQQLDAPLKAVGKRIEGS